MLKVRTKLCGFKHKTLYKLLIIKIWVGWLIAKVNMTFKVTFWLLNRNCVEIEITIIVRSFVNTTYGKYNIPIILEQYFTFNAWANCVTGTIEVKVMPWQGALTFTIMTLCIMTFSIIALSIMTLCIMTNSRMTNSIMTNSIMTNSIMKFSVMMLSIITLC